MRERKITWKDVTVQKARNLIALVDTGNYKAAGDALRREDGRGSAGSVRQNVEELREFYDRQLVRQNGAQWVPTEFGALVVAQSRRLVDRQEALCRLSATDFVLAFLPQHAFFVARVIRILIRDHQIEIIKHPMGEEDRSQPIFEAQVIGPLREDAIDIVIGPPPQSHEGLTATKLYTSQLVAMLPSDEAREAKTIELADLVKRPLLVPPRTTRSRMMLEDAIRDHGIDDPNPTTRVVLETYGTKALNDFGVEDFGVVVVPSDIAYQFMAGNRLGGSDAHRFGWVPVCVDGRPLTHDVFVTTRNDPVPAVGQIVELFQRETKYLDVGNDGSPSPAPRTTSGR